MIAAYRTLLAVGLVLVFFTNLANYGLRFGVPPLFWVAGFVVAAAPLALRDLLRRGLRVEPIGVWAFAYLLVSLLWFASSSQSALAWQGVQTRVLSVGFLLLATFLFSDARARQAARRTIVVATVLAVALNLWEVAFPMTFSDIPGRASGLFANVNQSGAALVLGLILGAPALAPGWRAAYALAAGVGILATVSRAAILGWLGVMAAWAARRGARGPALATAGLLAVAVVAFAVSPWWAATEQALVERGVLTENVRERLDVFGDEPADASTLERQQVAGLAWQAFAERPLAGAGTGASTETPFELGPHNMYLALMVDHGVVGLFLVPALLLAVAWGLAPARAPDAVLAVLFVAFWSFFSHNVLEERYLLLALGFVAAEAAAARAAGARPAAAGRLAPAGAEARAGVNVGVAP